MYNNLHSKGNMLGIILALVAALLWGSGDFSGGFATRKASPFQVLALSAISGIVVLGVAALVGQEAFPPGMGILWSLLAGFSGAVGITSLYTALSRGNAAAVAPISAVLGAALPVGFTFLTRGTPAVLQLIGFAVAFAGIWLVSMSAAADGKKDNHGLWLAFLAGAGFGGYFIFIGQVESTGVFLPLLLARGVMLVTALMMLVSSACHSPRSAAIQSRCWLACWILRGMSSFCLLWHFPGWISPWLYPACIRQSPCCWQPCCSRKR